MRFKTLNILALLTLTACGASSDDETDLETAFCELLADGPSESVSAADQPEVAVEDARVVIALTEGDTGFTGTVKYTPDEAGDFALGFSRDIPVRVLDASGAEVAVATQVKGAACPDLAIRNTYPMDIQTYTIEFGPTDVESVMMVSEESDDDA